MLATPDKSAFNHSLTVTRAPIRLLCDIGMTDSGWATKDQKTVEAAEWDQQLGMCLSANALLTLPLLGRLHIASSTDQTMKKKWGGGLHRLDLFLLSDFQLGTAPCK